MHLIGIEEARSKSKGFHGEKQIQKQVLHAFILEALANQE